MNAEQMRNEFENMLKTRDEFRDEKLDRKMLLLTETISVCIDKRIKDAPLHTMSSEAKARIAEIEKTNALQNETMSLMAVQVSEMYSIFTSSNWVARVILKVFGAMGVITAGIIGVIEVVRRSK